MGVLNIGLTGLNAANAGLLTTSHNIANAGTPGYSRQYATQQAQNPFFSGSGFLGTGVSVTTVRRQYDEFVNHELLAAQTNSTRLDTYQAQIAEIDDLLADPEAGLSPTLQGFFSAVQDLSANPTSAAARQSTISSGQSLASRFQMLDGRLNEIRSGINQQVSASVTGINAYATAIADINNRIRSIEVAGSAQPANDLRDQRDQLVAELNKELKVSTVNQSDGSVSVFIGNGQSLVVGGQPYQLAAIPDASDPQRLTVGQVLASGATAALAESMISGGTLGGLLSFRSGTLDAAQDALGNIALDIANSVNAQHRLGQTQTGALGGDFFSFTSGAPTARTAASEIRVAISDVRDIAAAGPIATAVGGANSGTASIDGGKVLSIASLPLGAGGVTLTYASATNDFTVSGIAGGPISYAAGAAITLGGLQFSISGTPANGDTFTLTNNASGNNDNRNALELGALQSGLNALGGTASYQSAYARLVSDVGNTARDVQINGTAAQTLVDQTTAKQQGISGVNLDEEAANLMRFQQAYQASSKVLEIAGKLFDQILALG